MSATTIKHVVAREVLDSRGKPTLETDVTLEGGAVGRAAVLRGASTGAHEALELRHEDKGRYRGAGVTEAFARAGAAAEGVSPYRWLVGDDACVLPVPFMNVLNGGAHAVGGVDFQEFMLSPAELPTFSDALRAESECDHVLRKILHPRGLSVGVGDEGGFAPALDLNEQATELPVEAIEKAGYRPGEDVVLAPDPTTTEIIEEGKHSLSRTTGGVLASDEMVAFWQSWALKFPIVSIEDDLGQDDREGWGKLTQAIGANVLLVGDDSVATQKARLDKGIEPGVANAILIKLNQVGSVSEGRDTIAVAKQASYGQMVSHRSGETEDVFIGDLVVATGAGRIKTGPRPGPSALLSTASSYGSSTSSAKKTRWVERHEVEVVLACST